MRPSRITVEDKRSLCLVLNADSGFANVFIHTVNDLLSVCTDGNKDVVPGSVYPFLDNSICWSAPASAEHKYEVISELPLNVVTFVMSYEDIFDLKYFPNFVRTDPVLGDIMFMSFEKMFNMRCDLEIAVILLNHEPERIMKELKSRVVPIAFKKVNDAKWIPSQLPGLLCDLCTTTRDLFMESQIYTKFHQRTPDIDWLTNEPRQEPTENVSCKVEVDINETKNVTDQSKVMFGSYLSSFSEIEEKRPGPSNLRAAPKRAEDTAAPDLFSSSTESPASEPSDNEMEDSGQRFPNNVLPRGQPPPQPRIRPIPDYKGGLHLDKERAGVVCVAIARRHMETICYSAFGPLVLPVAALLGTWLKVRTTNDKIVEARVISSPVHTRVIKVDDSDQDNVICFCKFDMYPKYNFYNPYLGVTNSRDLYSQVKTFVERTRKPPFGLNVEVLLGEDACQYHLHSSENNGQFLPFQKSYFVKKSCVGDSTPLQRRMRHFFAASDLRPFSKRAEKMLFVKHKDSRAAFLAGRYCERKLNCFKQDFDYANPNAVFNQPLPQSPVFYETFDFDGQRAPLPNVDAQAADTRFAEVKQRNLDQSQLKKQRTDQRRHAWDESCQRVLSQTTDSQNSTQQSNPPPANQKTTTSNPYVINLTDDEDDHAPRADFVDESLINFSWREPKRPAEPSNGPRKSVLRHEVMPKTINESILSDLKQRTQSRTKLSDAFEPSPATSESEFRSIIAVRPQPQPSDRIFSGRKIQNRPSCKLLHEESPPPEPSSGAFRRNIDEVTSREDTTRNAGLSNAVRHNSSVIYQVKPGKLGNSGAVERPTGAWKTTNLSELYSEGDVPYLPNFEIPKEVMDDYRDVLIRYPLDVADPLPPSDPHGELHQLFIIYRLNKYFVCYTNDGQFGLLPSTATCNALVGALFTAHVHHFHEPVARFYTFEAVPHDLPPLHVDAHVVRLYAHAHEELQLELTTYDLDAPSHQCPDTHWLRGPSDFGPVHYPRHLLHTPHPVHFTVRLHADGWHYVQDSEVPRPDLNRDPPEIGAYYNREQNPPGPPPQSSNRSHSSELYEPTSQHSGSQSRRFIYGSQAGPNNGIHQDQRQQRPSFNGQRAYEMNETHASDNWDWYRPSGTFRGRPQVYGRLRQTDRGPQFGRFCEPSFDQQQQQRRPTPGRQRPYGQQQPFYKRNQPPPPNHANGFYGSYADQPNNDYYDPTNDPPPANNNSGTNNTQNDRDYHYSNVIIEDVTENVDYLEPRVEFPTSDEDANDQEQQQQQPYTTAGWTVVTEDGPNVGLPLKKTTGYTKGDLNAMFSADEMDDVSEDDDTDEDQPTTSSRSGKPFWITDNQQNPKQHEHEAVHQEKATTPKPCEPSPQHPASQHQPKKAVKLVRVNRKPLNRPTSDDSLSSDSDSAPLARRQLRRRPSPADRVGVRTEVDARTTLVQTQGGSGGAGMGEVEEQRGDDERVAPAEAEAHRPPASLTYDRVYEGRGLDDSEEDVDRPSCTVQCDLHTTDEEDETDSFADNNTDCEEYLLDRMDDHTNDAEVQVFRFSPPDMDVRGDDDLPERQLNVETPDTDLEERLTSIHLYRSLDLWNETEADEPRTLDTDPSDEFIAEDAEAQQEQEQRDQMAEEINESDLDDLEF